MILIGRGLDYSAWSLRATEGQDETNWKRSEIESFDVQLSGCGKAPAELGAGANARA